MNILRRGPFLPLKNYQHNFNVRDGAAHFKNYNSLSILLIIWGMRHTSTALYFYGAFKKSLHNPRATSGNMLFHISYGFNYFLQLLCLQLLSTTHLNF
jgi:hypothetical protein